MNTLIIGLGSIGRRHARILRTLRPDAKVFALRSGKGFGPEEGVTDIGDLSELPGTIDLAILASPTDLHLDQVRKVLPFRPFLCLEKPLALTLKEGEEIVRTVEDVGVESYVGCQLRFHPELHRLHDTLHNGFRSVTGIRAVCHSWLPDWQPGRDYRKSFRADAHRSGGVHLELIHELDYVTWIFGSPEKRTMVLRSVPTLAISAPAEAHYELMYSNFVATIDLSYASHETERALTISFADGTSKTINLLLSPPALDEVYTSQMLHILACIDGSEHSLHPVREALQTLTLALP